MAKNTFKTLILDVRRPDDIERAINMARKLAKNVTIGIKYDHHSGLEISIRGPRDQIKIYEHQLIDSIAPTPPEPEDQEFIDDDEVEDDEEDSEKDSEEEEENEEDSSDDEDD